MKKKNKAAESIVVSVIAVLLLMLIDPCLSSILLFVLLGTILFKIDQRQLLLYSVGTIIVIGYLAICNKLYGSYFFGGNIESDDFQYELSSLEFYRSCGLDWRRLYDVLPLTHNSVGYVYLLALLRGWGDLFDGYSHFLPIILNIFGLNVAGFFLHKTALYYDIPGKICNIGAWIFCLYPSMLQLTAYTFRDVIVGLLIMIAFYHLLRPLTLRKITIVAICMFALFFLRMQITWMIGLLVVIFLFNPQKIGIKSAVVLFGGMILLLLIMQEIDISEKMKHYTELREETGGGILSRMMQLPICYGIFPRVSILSVTPMVVPQFAQAFAGISGISQFLTFPIVLMALINNKIDLKIKISFLLFFVGVSLSTFTFRHISMFLPFGFLLCMNMYMYGITQKNYLRNMALYITFWLTSVTLIFF